MTSINQSVGFEIWIGKKHFVKLQKKSLVTSKFKEDYQCSKHFIPSITHEIPKRYHLSDFPTLHS